jgi:hypothetical protein
MVSAALPRSKCSVSLYKMYNPAHRWPYFLAVGDLQLAHPQTRNINCRLEFHTALPARRVVSAPLCPVGWVASVSYGPRAVGTICDF